MHAISITCEICQQTSSKAVWSHPGICVDCYIDGRQEGFSIADIIDIAQANRDIRERMAGTLTRFL